MMLTYEEVEKIYSELGKTNCCSDERISGFMSDIVNVLAILTDSFTECNKSSCCHHKPVFCRCHVLLCLSTCKRLFTFRMTKSFYSDYLPTQTVENFLKTMMLLVDKDDRFVRYITQKTLVEALQHPLLKEKTETVMLKLMEDLKYGSCDISIRTRLELFVDLLSDNVSHNTKQTAVKTLSKNWNMICDKFCIYHKESNWKFILCEVLIIWQKLSKNLSLNIENLLSCEQNNVILQQCPKLFVVLSLLSKDELLITNKILHVLDSIFCYGKILSVTININPVSYCEVAAKFLSWWNLEKLLNIYDDKISEKDPETSRSLRIISLVVLKAIAVLLKFKQEPDEWDSEQLALESITTLNSFITLKLRCKRTCDWLCILFCDQDDDWIEALIALLDIFLHTNKCWNKEAHDNGLQTRTKEIINPHIQFIIFVKSVSFDHMILLDWLTSPETCFLFYITRYVRLMISEWPEFVQQVLIFHHLDLPLQSEISEGNKNIDLIKDKINDNDSDEPFDMELTMINDLLLKKQHDNVKLMENNTQVMSFDSFNPNLQQSKAENLQIENNGKSTFGLSLINSYDEDDDDDDDDDKDSDDDDGGGGDDIGVGVYSDLSEFIPKTNDRSDQTSMCKIPPVLNNKLVADSEMTGICETDSNMKTMDNSGYGQVKTCNTDKEPSLSLMSCDSTTVKNSISVCSVGNTAKQYQEGDNQNFTNSEMETSFITPNTSEANSITSDTSEASSITPNTSETKSITPDTSETNSITPDTSETKSITPDTSETKSITPDTSETKSITPDTSETNSITPDTSEACFITPDTSKACFITPDTGTSEACFITPDTSETSFITPDTSKTKSITPYTSETNSITPNTRETNSITPDTSEACFITPDTSETNSITSDSSEACFITSDTSEACSITPDSSNDLQYKETLLDTIMTMFIRLRMKIEVLWEAELFPYNPAPLVSLIAQCEQLYES